MKRIKIDRSDIDFIREPLLAPFGFKGRYLTELFQSVVKLSSSSKTATFPAVESVLWSDGDVFASNPPAAANTMMFMASARAAKMLEGMEFTTPVEVIRDIFPELKKYCDILCGREVAETFVLNSLVGIDYALWSLYAQENDISSFDQIIPDISKEAMNVKHKKLAHIPLISYAVGMEEIRQIAANGNPLLKIKIGKSVVSGADKQTDMKTMLEWDKKRISDIHAVLSEYESPYTHTGKILYYLDANGRYDSCDRLNELLEHCDRIGALQSIALLEEPFPAHERFDVSGFPVCINADESAHSLKDVRERLEMGYKAVALKPIAKTMSVSFEMLGAVHKAGGQALCADLTVNPLLAELNKQFAARTNSLAGMKIGCVEINGDQNYVNWNRMKSYLPDGFSYGEPSGGVFELDDTFYRDGIKLLGDNGYGRVFTI